MPKCPKCKVDIDQLNTFVQETNKYEVDLECCPRNIPAELRGKANYCLAGGPKTERHPGGSFCSYLEEVGKCKLVGDYVGLRWYFDQAMEGSATRTDFDCPKCDHNIFTFEGDDSYYTAVEEFLKGKLYTCDELCIRYTTKECVTQEGWTFCNKPDKYKEVGDLADSQRE